MSSERTWVPGRDYAENWSAVRCITCCGSFGSQAEAQAECDRLNAQERMRGMAEEMLESLEDLMSEEFKKARGTLESGPGGTTPENIARAFIDEREKKVMALIQKAREA